MLQLQWGQTSGQTRLHVEVAKLTQVGCHRPDNNQAGGCVPELCCNPCVPCSPPPPPPGAAPDAPVAACCPRPQSLPTLITSQVEATKFTEVGYHGRDVDQIIRDLVETSIGLVKKRCKKAAAKIVSVHACLLTSELCLMP